MACSSSFAVLLAILVLGGALVEAAGRPWGSWSDSTQLNNHEDVGDLVEEERVTIPSFLQNYVSSMDPEKIKQYVASLEEHTMSQHSTEFCQDAKLMYDSNIAIVDPSMDISRDAHEDDQMFQETGELVDEVQPLSFGEKDIVEGQDIVFPESLHDLSYPSPSFLPHSLAEKMPFSSEKIHELMDTLHILYNSNLATMMSRTISRCELTKEKSSKEIKLSNEKEINEEEIKEVKEKEVKGVRKDVKEKDFKEVEEVKEKDFKEVEEVKEKDVKEKQINGKGIKENKKEKEIKNEEIKDKEIKEIKKKEERN